MDALREQQWQELLDIQQHQIELLHEQIELLRSGVGTDPPSSAPASD